VKYLAELIALFAALVSVPAQADQLKVVGNRLYLSASVNGHPVEALLDSAAEISISDVAASSRLGLEHGTEVTARGSGGEQQARVVPEADVAALGVTLKGVPLAIIDLSDVGARLLGRRIDFILGRDFFDATRLAIDIAAGSIAVVPGTERPAGAELALTEHDGIVSIPVEFGGKTVQADFDLGNGTGVLISKAQAQLAGLRIVGLEPAGGIGGATARAVVYLPSLIVAGKRFTHVRAHIDPQDNAGDLNIGVPQLRQFHIVTDFAAKKVWLDPIPD
jgi:predicted aspartyl protease